MSRSLDSTRPIGERVSAIETMVEDHEHHLSEMRVEMASATSALWAALDAVRAKPQIPPSLAAIISTLTAAVGVLTTIAVRGG